MGAVQSSGSPGYLDGLGHEPELHTNTRGTLYIDPCQRTRQVLQELESVSCDDWNASRNTTVVKTYRNSAGEKTAIQSSADGLSDPNFTVTHAVSSSCQSEAAQNVVTGRNYIIQAKKKSQNVSITTSIYGGIL